MKRLIILITCVIAIGVLLYMLITKEAIPIPADLKHTVTTDESICFGCHENNEDMPLKKEHTPKQTCFECHKRAEKTSGDKKG